MRLAVQQLFLSAASSIARLRHRNVSLRSSRSASRRRSEVAARDELLRSTNSIREVRRRDIDGPCACSCSSALA